VIRAWKTIVKKSKKLVAPKTNPRNKLGTPMTISGDKIDGEERIAMEPLDGRD
jgi:hypothetical protein